MISRNCVSLKVLFVTFLILFMSFAAIPLASVQADQALTLQRVWGSGIAVDSEGVVAMTGSTVSFSKGEADALLIKYDRSGKLLCFKTFGRYPQNSFGYGVAFDTSDNMYWTGASQVFDGQRNHVFLIKFDSSCNQIYQYAWGGSQDDIGRGVATDALDNVYVVGSTRSYGAGQADAFLLKYNGVGEFQFETNWGGNRSDYANAVAVDGSGNIYVTGATESYGLGQSDVFLLKYDPAGNLLWQTVWGGKQIDYGSGVAVDYAGNIYVTGTTYSFGAIPGIPNAFLLKYDPQGNLLFKQTWETTLTAFGTGVAVNAPTGNAYVTGYTYGSSATPGTPKAFLLEYDPSGNLLMQKTWGGNRGDYGYGVAVDMIGNIFLTGYTFSFGPNTQGVNFFLLMYDSLGNLILQKIYGGGPPDQRSLWTP